MNADAPTPTPTPDPSAIQPVAETPPLPAPESPPPVPPNWPEWFRHFDVALAILAVVLAFVMGSFVARNSDVWRHLAAGRLLTQFQYPLGGDPFTYTAADRAWVNANWLGEVLLYLFHAADSSGAITVGVKAVVFAAALGLVFVLRKPGAPLWPWAVAAAVGAVAAGGFTQLRPQLLALPLLSGILAVLYTADWAKGSKWRVPAILGGLTAVWANVDGFAFLSPLLLGLVLVGDWFHPKVFPAHTDLPSERDPFRSAPAQNALLRALLLCVVALLLNPTFLGAVVRNPVEAFTQLVPFELDWQAAQDLKGDRDLYRYTFSVLHPAEVADGGVVIEPGFLGNPVLGYNPSGMFTIGLWVAGAIAAGVGYRHGRLSHVLVWLVFTLLGAVVHARFVPYGILVGVPFLAAHLNGFGRLVPSLDKLSVPVARGVVNGCVAARVMSMLGLAVLVLSAVPGWLHPWDGTAAGRRYVGWGILPDEGMKRGAEVLAAWRADTTPITVRIPMSTPGGMPNQEQEVTSSRSEVLGSTRGLNTHPDLGDYLAYFAPAEKSFITSRYRLHRSELPEVVEVRKQALTSWQKYEADMRKYQAVASQRTPPPGGMPPEPKSPVEVGWLRTLADKYGIGYVCVAQSGATYEQEVLLNTRLGFGVTTADDQKLFGPPWHLDGRLLVVGRTFTLTADEQADFLGQRRTGEAAIELEKKLAELRVWGKNNRVMTLDVAKGVFGPRKLPDSPPPLAIGVPPQQGWEYDLLLLHPPPRPIGLDDARNLSWYADTLAFQRELRNQRRQRKWQQVTQATADSQEPLAMVGGPPLALTVMFPPPPSVDVPSDPEYALPFLIARASRDGLAVDPNANVGFLTLADAYNKPLMPRTDVPHDLFALTQFPPFGPTETELQVITGLRRAIARLPKVDQPTDEHMVDSIRTRVLLVNALLSVGPKPPVIAFRRNQAGQVERVVEPGVRIGYVDAARTVLNELSQAIDNLPANKQGDTSHAGDAARAFMARQLVALWRQVLPLCMADFWTDFPRTLNSGLVPPDWWENIRKGNLISLLVDKDYLTKDDWGGWQEAFEKDAAQDKVDPESLKYRTKRLWAVLNTLVTRRTGRLPAPTDRPTDAFYGFVVSGLPEQALRMAESDEFASRVNVTNGDAIRLLLWVGRAEEAQGELVSKAPKLESADMPAAAREIERAKFRAIELELAKLNGDYAKVDVLYAELLDTKLGPMPPLDSMTTIMYSDLWRPAAFPRLSDSELKLLVASDAMLASAGAVGGWSAVGHADQALRALQRRLLFQSYTHYQRGVYALLGGDTARARDQFEKAGDPQGIKQLLPPLPPDAPPEAKEWLPVQRVGLPQAVAPSLGEFLPKYLELLKKYEAK